MVFEIVGWLVIGLFCYACIHEPPKPKDDAEEALRQAYEDTQEAIRRILKA